MELKSSEDTKKFSKVLQKGDVIFLYGEIGVGKTTFVRFLINQLEVENSVKKSDVLSPTFNIVYDYDIKKRKILHYDLYRIKSYKDFLELGMFEKSENNIIIVEWPELIKEKPINRIDIKFQYLKDKDSRKVIVSGSGNCKEYKLNEI